MNTLKSVSAILLCVVLSIPVFAQQNDSLETMRKVADRQKNNIIKINLSALVFKNISVQYERKIAKRISFAVNVHYIPFGELPFLSSIKKAIDDPSVPVDKLKFGGLGFTPEMRFYIGRKGALRGFYLAPFANYTGYKADLPINYGSESKTAIFSGNISTLTGGLLLGAQWKLGKSVYLDWWIIGPNYGISKGNLNLNTELSGSEQTDLTAKIEKLRADAPFNKIIESYTVSETGAFIKAKGPWAGLRGLGFNLGFRF